MFDYKIFKNDFVNIAQAINNDNYTYSNEVLYAACNGVDVLPPAHKATWEQKDKLTSMMLLIGRAYAASPERRKGAKSINDGMMTFFEKLTEGIITNKQYAEWRSAVVELATLEYAFDGKENDHKLLKESYDCVILLNAMIKEAIWKIDEKSSLDDVGNCLSFCTKLLHFIVPNIFYIKDGISWDGIWSIYRRRSSSELKYGEQKLEISKYAFGEALNQEYPCFAAGKNEKVDEAEPQYWYHCRGCYAISCVMKEIKLVSQTRGFNGIQNVYSLPRLVDTVLLNIKN